MVYNFLVFDCTGRLLVLQYVMDIQHIGVFILTIFVGLPVYNWFDL